MPRALLALTMSIAVASAATGCVTTVGIVKRDDVVTLPMLGGAAGADFAVTALAASQIQDYSLGASLATALAVTALDVAIGCLIGACAVLRP
jgi:hypothetical protein